MTGEMFKAYVEQFLARQLKRATFYSWTTPVFTRQLESRTIEARGATPVYLPAYSPDFNPIDNFRQTQSHLRKIAAFTLKTPRTPSTACARPSSFV